MRVTDKYVFFWKGWLSNFWRAPFQVDGKVFFCTEQYFMYQKAVTFKDWEIAEKIMKVLTPLEARSLGQQVKGYSDLVWAPIREEVMEKANLEKYRQNPYLKERLLDPTLDGKHFVEASPFDRIWAIGMREEEPGITDPANWKGTNLLGQCLDRVREKLRE